MEKVYNKLVRDHIPSIIEQDHEIPITRILDDNDYRTELYKKLLEECNEVIQAGDEEEILNEAADVLEVLKSIVELGNKKLEDIIKIANQKRLKRGGFEKRIFLEKSIQKKGEKNMNNELVMKKCLKCGAIVKVIKDCNCKDCGIVCCGEKMQTMKANSTDAVVEKHVPTYEIEEDMIKVRVNHVMDEDHFIEWICLKTENKEEYIHLSPKEEAVATFKNVQSGTLYAYCNKHGLWSTKIDKERK